MDENNQDQNGFERLIASVLQPTEEDDPESGGQSLTVRNMGQIADAEGLGRSTGSCGDTMEMSLRIRDDRIIDSKFLTEGCIITAVVGSLASELARGKTVQEAMRLCPEDIISAAGGLPPEHDHCADLACNTLKQALMDYLTNKREPWKAGYRK
ncbi:MAG TPA: iron-sulfur cluster assembly scaffold protein [Thermodesulfobacteriota bacterium]|nr:iron-sulfur cluster assembly scaffold protein [Deltaproteobacteria bacterium]HNR12755.1 iron-sulfur cluster assembly scaffold protein [Thermodesulfobacteriota bacterium]HNU70290.1 iron-sulfur cluster assembly scaffold protein [Thermodesulfobacteriota bacterium]HQO78261.1 iron-sulfur cluster assembly scaffold protein [Thermodesulfobacteriota bacterium]